MTVQDYYYIDADLVKMDDNFYDSEGLLGRVLAGKTHIGMGAKLVKMERIGNWIGKWRQNRMSPINALEFGANFKWVRLNVLVFAWDCNGANSTIIIFGQSVFCCFLVAVFFFFKLKDKVSLSTDIEAGERPGPMGHRPRFQRDQLSFLPLIFNLQITLR